MEKKTPENTLNLTYHPVCDKTLLMDPMVQYRPWVSGLEQKGKFKRPHCDLTGIMVSKGNHSQTMFIQFPAKCDYTWDLCGDFGWFMDIMPTIQWTVPYKAIFCGNIPLHNPDIRFIYVRYLQSRCLKWPLINTHMIYIQPINIYIYIHIYIYRR